MNLYTRSECKIAFGYERIVIGERGPYVEFNDDQIIQTNLFIPEDQKWRLNHVLSFYNEYRTALDNVKVYHQKKLVSYADYLIGKWYISPFDLRTKKHISAQDVFEELIVPLVTKVKK